jgi:tRNA(fMet)-specific endonuclease VapC
MNTERRVRLFRNGRNQALRIPREFESTICSRSMMWNCNMGDHRYLSDTNIVSDLVRHPAGRVMEWIARAGEETVCTRIVVASELRFDAAKKGSEKLSRQLETVLSGFDVLPLEVPADEHYAVLRLVLERTGTSIGPNDMLIAAHALTLVTDNLREFSRVPGLSVENWLEPAGRGA